MTPRTGTDAPGVSRPVAEVIRVFLWLGTVGFGGPVAHLALMEEEVVRRRRWVTIEEFLDLVGLTNLIPGPNSTEMAMALGHQRAGWPGLLAAGASFILPAAAITGTLAWLYLQYGTLPQVEPWLAALGPAVVGLMGGAVVRLARPAFARVSQIAIGAAVLVLALAGVDEVVLLVGGGVAGALVDRARRVTFIVLLAVTLPAVVTAAREVAGVETGPSDAAIALFFLRTGAVLYGGGYVHVALLQPLVDSYGWLSQAQLVDAVAAGHVTPGPVLTTATFVGFLLGGAGGAAIATVAIFLPAFLLVGGLGHIAPRLRAWPPARGLLDGVNAAAVALMVAVTVTLARAVVTDVIAVAVVALSVAAGLRGVSGGWIVLGGIAAGGVLRMIGV